MQLGRRPTTLELIKSVIKNTTNWPNPPVPVIEAFTRGAYFESTYHGVPWALGVQISAEPEKRPAAGPAFGKLTFDRAQPSLFFFARPPCRPVTTTE